MRNFLIASALETAWSASSTASRPRRTVSLTLPPPARASFAVALNAARDQVILARPAADLAGTIGMLVPASLTPGRRLRISPRIVKRAMSRYNARGKVDRATRSSPSPSSASP